MSDKTRALTKNIMAKIKKENIQMKPHWFFVLGSILLGLGLAGAFMVSMFFMGTAMFHLRTHSPVGFIPFGPLGFLHFLIAFPWGPLLIALGGFTGGLGLLKTYDVSYKHSLSALIIALLIGTVTTGYLIDASGVNDEMRRRPPFAPLYRNLGEFKGIVGLITKVEKDFILIQTPTGEKVTILYDPAIFPPLTPGQHIHALGEKEGSTFKATDIRIDPERGRKRSLDPPPGWRR